MFIISQIAQKSYQKNQRIPFPSRREKKTEGSRGKKLEKPLYFSCGMWYTRCKKLEHSNY